MNNASYNLNLTQTHITPSTIVEGRALLENILIIREIGDELFEIAGVEWSSTPHKFTIFAKSLFREPLDETCTTFAASEEYALSIIKDARVLLSL